GMETLVATLARRLPEGVVRLRAPVTTLARESGQWRLVAGGASLSADVLVLAAPAPAASAFLAPCDPTLGRLLGAIDYASSATVSLGYRAVDVPALRGLGFVVPARERRALLACTYSSRKFAGRAPEGFELLRTFVGGVRRPELAALDTDALITTVRGELRDLLGITAAPVLTRVRHRFDEHPADDLGVAGVGERPLEQPLDLAPEGVERLARRRKPHLVEEGAKLGQREGPHVGRVAELLHAVQRGGLLPIGGGDEVDDHDASARDAGPHHLRQDRPR